jgi:hypothetical protein
VFLAALNADEAQIEASFGEAIRIAKEQKSVSLEKRAEATYAEYRRQKASGSGGRGFRLASPIEIPPSYYRALIKLSRLQAVRGNPASKAASRNSQCHRGCDLLG